MTLYLGSEGSPYEWLLIKNQKLKFPLQPLNRNTAQQNHRRPLRILQFGGGNFLRGFIDWIVERLNETSDFNGGVVVVKPTPKGDYQALRQQEGLYHTYLRGITEGAFVSEQQLITCIQQIVHPYQEWPSFLATAEEKDIRYIISNTTEAGIKFKPCPVGITGPTSLEFPGKMTQWLYHRWSHFQGAANAGCICLPTELIEDNGDKLQRAILQYAKHWELETGFIEWLYANCYFCNTLVDRIVAGFPTNDAIEIQKQIGFQDDLLVAGEYYHSWVIQPPPHLSEQLPFVHPGLNITTTEALNIHRTIKVRLLNGAHTAMVPTGYLSGLRTVGQVMKDPAMQLFIQGLLYEEIIPSLPYPRQQLERYANQVIDRFLNPSIQHQLIDISLNSTTKFRTRLLPSLLEYHAKMAQLPKRIIKAFAALICFYRGHFAGQSIPLKDEAPRIAFFASLWQQYQDEQVDLTGLSEQVLAQTQWWGQDLNTISGLTSALSQEIKTYLN